jgi:hypothetical protein
MHAPPFFAVAAILSTTVARADPVHFTGTTTVDRTVIADALQQVKNVGLAKLKCGEMTSVESSILTATYSPKDTQNYAEPGKETYERWVVTFCGKTVPFLLGFWPASDGGTMFHVSYPFPADANSAASPASH